MPYLSAKNTQRLAIVSLLLVAAGALLYLGSIPLTSYLLPIGGVGLAVAYLLSGDRDASIREKRLHRMGFLGALAYVVAGGFILKRDNVWILAFTIGTVLLLYSLWVPQERKNK